MAENRLSEKFIESLSVLKSRLADNVTDDDAGVNLQGIYEKFIELVAFYHAKTTEDTKNYITEAMLQRMRNLFPYFFNMLPNRILTKIIPQIALQRPLPVNIGEQVNGYTISSEEKPVKQDIYMKNIMDCLVLPFDLSFCEYNYDKKVLEINFRGEEPFYLDTTYFHLWINYNNDTATGIIIHDKLSVKFGYLEVFYTDKSSQVYPVEISTAGGYEALHPNAKSQLFLNSPEFFLFLKIKIEQGLIDNKTIASMKLQLPVSPLIAKYDVNRIFHLNLMPLMNIHTEFAEVISFNSAEGCYPLIHPLKDEFIPYFIHTVSYESGKQKGKISSELFTSDNNEATFRLVYESDLLSKRYRQIALDMPLDILEAKISVKADWVQVYEINPSNVSLEFYNKQIGSFKLSTILCRKFKDINDFIKSGNILGLLKLHNCSYLTLGDMRLLINTLISKESIFHFLTYDLIDLELHHDEEISNLSYYSLVFKESNEENHAFAVKVVKSVEDFLNSNLGFSEKIVLEPIFRAVKVS